jgi:hypothetical protein
MSDPIPALEDKRFDSHECARQMSVEEDSLLEGDTDAERNSQAG